LRDLIEAGKIKPAIDRIYPLSDAATGTNPSRADLPSEIPVIMTHMM
jgi:hypothetical protein